MSGSKISAMQTAKLIILNAHFYGEEKERPISRYKISRNTLRIISDRAALRDSFIIELEHAMAELGWLFVQNNDDECCFMVMTTTGNWAKLSSKRLTSFIKDPETIDDEYEHKCEL
ncbi:hypothetical protein [Erwinia sp. MYb535]|uniref:hypothetical protein n=1 Tax=Erwinia sp. MYb535 TaxID=2745309 RepID=UPI0030A8912E